MVKVGDIMDRELVTLEGEATAQEAGVILARGDVDCILVVEEGSPRGLITQRDLVRTVVSEDRTGSDVELRSIMSKPLITIEVWKDVRSATDLLTQFNIRRILVEDHGRIVGLVSQKNIVDAIISNN